MERGALPKVSRRRIGVGSEKGWKLPWRFVRLRVPAMAGSGLRPDSPSLIVVHLTAGPGLDQGGTHEDRFNMRRALRLSSP
jgi:hypothetical protein